jgi:tripeptide aminopeptidase
MVFSADWFQKQILDRFLTYVKIHTTSDRHVDAIPSTPGQWDLLKLLADELRSIGVSDIELTEQGYLIARIPPTAGSEGVSTIAFMAHVDTVSDAPGEGVKPQVFRDYSGDVITLKGGVVIDPSKNDVLASRVGDTIITSDGTTLLGADDKAGIAEIVTAAAWLLSHPEVEHGGVELVFTPDEETGRGMDLFPVDKLNSVCAYTLDGDVEGTIEAECFNAEKADVSFTGVSIHPGTARGGLVNAVAMAASFATMLPRNESPEATDGRYGFYLPMEISGTHEQASLSILLRDFEQEEIERRRRTLGLLAEAVQGQYPGGTVTIECTKQYVNMRQYLDDEPLVVELLEEAVRASGMEPITKIIRGGTDGARLSAMGIPTPNIFTGGNSYHSRGEWAALGVMVRASQVVLHLISLWQRKGAGAASVD